MSQKVGLPRDQRVGQNLKMQGKKQVSSTFVVALQKQVLSPVNVRATQCI